MAKLKEFLLHIEHIALTSDLWKNKKREYFLTIIAHYLVKSFCYRSIVISFRKFYDRHYSQMIEAFLIKELDTLSIRAKIVSTTTDNEATMARTCRAIALRFPCLAHFLNLIVKNGLQLWKRLKK